MSQIQTGLLVLLLTFLGVVGYNVYINETTPIERPYSEFITLVEQDKIKSIHLKGGEVTAEDILSHSFSSYIPDVALVMPLFKEKKITITAESAAENWGGFMKINAACSFNSWRLSDLQQKSTRTKS